MAESVELATILLTDLVGSTRLATSVGPLRADELREQHFDLLRDAIVAADGREVKNTGDGLMVAFSSPSAAVKCAVAMQQRFERRYRQAEQALHVRIGLGAGESTVKDGDYFGLPSIEAARLCAQAPADGILVSAGVEMFAGRCEGVEFTSAGELELKGFPEPVQAFSVSWAPLPQETALSARWPLPAVLRSVPPVAYVGRGSERAALDGALALARGGSRQAVLLSGEPGIGKTRLASFAAHRASHPCAREPRSPSHRTRRRESEPVGQSDTVLYGELPTMPPERPHSQAERPCEHRRTARTPAAHRHPRRDDQLLLHVRLHRGVHATRSCWWHQSGPLVRAVTDTLQRRAVRLQTARTWIHRRIRIGLEQGAVAAAGPEAASAAGICLASISAMGS